MSADVAGHCPMGCGRTLFVAKGGHITCSWHDCPHPGAVDDLLADPETEHVVTFDDKGFAIQHPLRERLDGELFDCRLHQDLRDLAGPPVRPGRYRARRHEPDGYSESYRGDAIGWDFDEIKETTTR